jgi:hypothetical protein
MAAAASNAFNSKLIRADGTTVPVEVRVTRLTLYDRPLVLRLCHEIIGREAK